jgi:hypothetical protein
MANVVSKYLFPFPRLTYAFVIEQLHECFFDLVMEENGEFSLC